MSVVKIEFGKSGVTLTDELKSQAAEANELLHSGSGAGIDFVGWVSLPASVSDEELSAVEECARALRSRADAVVCIGIGGSYLGARAVLEALGTVTSETGPALMDELTALTGVAAPKPLASLAGKPVRFDKWVPAADMEQAVGEFLS